MINSCSNLAIEISICTCVSCNWWSWLVTILEVLLTSLFNIFLQSMQRGNISFISHNFLWNFNNWRLDLLIFHLLRRTYRLLHLFNYSSISSNSSFQLPLQLQTNTTVFVHFYLKSRLLYPLKHLLNNWSFFCSNFNTLLFQIFLRYLFLGTLKWYRIALACCWFECCLKIIVLNLIKVYLILILFHYKCIQLFIKLILFNVFWKALNQLLIAFLI